MMGVKKKEMESLLDKAIDKAAIHKKTQLISMTKKVRETDPIQFFEGAKHLSQDRTFWASTSDDFYIVGVGNAANIKADDNRLQETERQWREIINEAIIHNPFQVPGTGLLALGGMAFDSGKQQTKLWENFNPSSFRIPEFILTKHRDVYYVTINAQASKDDHPEDLAKALEQTEKKLLSYSEKLPNKPNIQRKTEIEPDQWMDSVRHAIEEIKENKAEKIVLAREMRLKLSKDAEIAVMLKQLIKTQANSYVFAFEYGEDCFIGATPERLVKLEKNQLFSTCLAGTAPRGKTPEEDAKISDTLFQDAKNREEHDFVVQMIRKLMEKYCIDIDIPDEPVIYPLKNLQHLYTPVTATLKNGYSIFDIINQLHPTPALGGVPREESLAFIREHERLDRGWYGAPIGWLDSNQNGEFAVAIRSCLIQGEAVSLFAGCGIMKDSDPQAEYEETTIKFSTMLSVLGG